MKLSDKRFWNGEKTIYYPSFKYVLTDSLLFSALWTGAISLLLNLICLIIYLNGIETLSLHTISAELILLFSVFIISNGIFLHENWFKQCHIIVKTKRLLPKDCDIQSIQFDSTNKDYKITIGYMGKTFKITVEHQSLFYISEKGIRALGPLNIDSCKDLEENKLLVINYMS